MTVFQKILVPYDGTKSSQRSLSYAFNLSKLTNSEITVLFCLIERFTFGFFKTKADKKIFKKQKLEKMGCSSSKKQKK